MRTGEQQERDSSAIGGFLREYVPSMDPHGYMAYIADLQRARFERFAANGEIHPAMRTRWPHRGSDEGSDSVSVMSTWSEESREDALLFMLAAEHPAAFGSIDNDDAD